MGGLTVPDAARGPLARRHPLAKVGAALLLGLVCVASLDPVTPLLVLAGTLATVPATGVRAGDLLRRSRPLLLTALGVATVTVLVGESRGGRLLLDAGPLDVTQDGLSTGVAIGLRILAVALPGVLAVATTDPVELADGLVQTARLPHRPAYGALAALRLLPLLGEEWQTVARARRARGIDAGRNPVGALRLFATQVLGLLVAAVRRGTRLAAAMDARGFDAGGPRSTARPLVLRPADGLLVAGAAALGTAAITTSVLLGTWRPLLGTA